MTIMTADTILLTDSHTANYAEMRFVPFAGAMTYHKSLVSRAICRMLQDGIRENGPNWRTDTEPQFQR